MRDFRKDWRRWTPRERIGAVALVLLVLMSLPIALAI